MLFASPRAGNFEVYAVELNDAGKQALKDRSTADSATPAAVAESAAAQPVAPTQPLAAPHEHGPGAHVYLLALMAVGLVWGAVELMVFSRRRRR